MTDSAPTASLPLRLRLLALCIAWLVRAVAATWRVRRVDGHLYDRALAEGGTVLAFFHGHMVAMVALHEGSRLAAMASLSRDGDLLARVVQVLGYGVIRGSSSRGGREALEGALELVRQGVCPGLAVDGPRGPRHVPHPGAVVLSARSGRPIVYAVARAHPALLMRSWDRTLIPMPFARVTLRYGRMEPPSDEPQALQRALAELGERLNALDALA